MVYGESEGKGILAGAQPPLSLPDLFICHHVGNPAGSKEGVQE